MASLISLIVIFTFSILITKIATEVLVHTGLSKQTAKFQARSAFTGVGYTTKEAENIVNHPARRKIIMSLMLIGNVGIISAIASLMLTFVDTGQSSTDNIIRVGIILGSMVVLWLLSRSKWVERLLVNTIKTFLKKFTQLRIRDYVELLDLKGDYEITVLEVQADDWMENQKVGELKLWQEGINLIGIQRDDGTYLGIPKHKTKITRHDQIILYGRKESLQNLKKRKKNITGEKDHKEAVKEQDKEEKKQDKKDKRSRE